MEKLYKKLWRRVRSYLAFIAIALGTGALSCFVSKNAMESYGSLAKPPLSPPSWLFSAVWAALFILMGVSSAIVWRNSHGGQRHDALFVWGLQLFVLFFWNVFYFVLEYRLLAFIWLLLLILLVISMVRHFSQISKAASRLQILYLLWLIFTGYLNFAVYLLNK